MKLSFTILLVSVCQLFAIDSKAQNAAIELPSSLLTVGELFAEIEEQTDYLVVYSDSEVDTEAEVRVKKTKTTVSDCLNDFTSNGNLKYEFTNNYIVFSDRGAVAITQQNKNQITGIVTDSEGEPLPGAVIIAKGESSNVVTTDIDGKFTISIDKGTSLEFSYIGYETQVVNPGNRSNIDVVLKEDSELLDEAVVVGFGTQKKANLTGAVASVKMDDVLGDRPVTSLGSILQGAIPGLTASSSPIPGEKNTFNIRGIATIAEGGGSPLILVDNVPYENLNLLNPADIESVSVLKDASSAAIYGARASFGVILITTKKGRKNEQLTVSYNNNFSWKTDPNMLEMATPIEFMTALQDGGVKLWWPGQNVDTYVDLLNKYNSNPAEYPDGFTYVDNLPYYLKETDDQRDMIENSFQHVHNLSARGGSEHISYRMSFGYVEEDGVLVTNKDSFERISVSGDISGDITPWLTTSLHMSYNNGNRTYPIFNSNTPVPFTPLGNTTTSDGKEYMSQTPGNVVRLSEPSETRTDDTKIFGKALIKPFKGFTAAVEYSFQTSMVDYSQYKNMYALNQAVANKPWNVWNTSSFEAKHTSRKYSTLNVFANYKESFNDAHNFEGIIGFNQEYLSERYLRSFVQNIISDEIPSLSATDGVLPPQTNDTYDKYALRSAFLRLTYNYKERYFIELNGRYDLSSKFPKDSRAGYFPSVSAAWRIDNEPFMKNVKDVISLLKIRGSYGVLGNQNIDNYGYYPIMKISNANWIENGIKPIQVQAPGMVRNNFTWETVETINGGIELGFLDNKLLASFDVYRRYTRGMLGPGLELPSVAGATAPLQNAADLETNGWELTIGWKDNIGDFSYGLAFNVYDSRSKILKFKNETKLLFDSSNKAMNYVGREFGEIWGYVTDGFYTYDDFEGGKLKEGITTIQGVISNPGDIKYKNLLDSEVSENRIDTGDNTFDNPGDRVRIGNETARYNYGLNGFFGWKGLDLSFIIQGVGKRDYWIGGSVIFPHAAYGTLLTHQTGKIWTEDNQENAYYGRLYQDGSGQVANNSSNQRVSDKFLRNGAYLRLKNLTLSYSFPRKMIEKIHLSNLKIFLSGENLLTLDHLPEGIDPERKSLGYPYFKTFSFGINISL